MNKIRNKGFTLIELLAVIVILAIILLIAVPQVLGVIDDVKKGADVSSAKMIVKAAEKYAALQMMNGGSLDTGHVTTCNNFDLEINNPAYESYSSGVWNPSEFDQCGALFNADGSVASVTYGPNIQSLAPSALDVNTISW